MLVKRVYKVRCYEAYRQGDQRKNEFEEMEREFGIKD